MQNLLPVNLVLNLFVFWLAARLYLLPRLDRLDPRSVLLPILLMHAMRHLGLMFLVPGATYAGLPPQFAYPAALGDLVAAGLATVALAAMLWRSPLARPLLWIFNLEGSLDLIAAIALGVRYHAPDHLGPTYWIPALWVPALLVTHYVVFLILLRGRALRPATSS